MGGFVIVARGFSRRAFFLHTFVDYFFDVHHMQGALAITLLVWYRAHRRMTKPDLVIEELDPGYYTPIIIH